MKKIILIEQELSLKLARQPGSIHLLELTKKTVGQGVKRQLRRSGVFIVNFEHTSHLILVFLLLALSR